MVRDMGMLPDHMYNENWTEKDERLALAKYRREQRKKQEEQRQKYWGWFDTAFPELKGIPAGWLIVAIICFLFCLITMVII